MLYFFLLLILQCAVSVLVSMLLLHMVRNSLRNRVRRAWLYPVPSLLTVLLVVFTVLFTVPSLLDANGTAALFSRSEARGGRPGPVSWTTNLTIPSTGEAVGASALRISDDDAALPVAGWRLAKGSTRTWTRPALV